MTLLSILPQIPPSTIAGVQTSSSVRPIHLLASPKVRLTLLIPHLFYTTGKLCEDGATINLRGIHRNLRVSRDKGNKSILQGIHYDLLGSPPGLRGFPIFRALGYFSAMGIFTPVFGSLRFIFKR